MTAKGGPSNASELREILRRGDPLSEDRPTIEEVRRMRQAVLNGSFDRTARPSSAWRSLAAFAGATALLALAAMAALWMVRPASQQTRLHPASANLAASNAPPAAPVPSPTSVQPPAHAAANGVIASAPPAAGRPRAGRRQHAGQAIAPETAGTREGGRQQYDRPRQLQFTAPGGTRLVWVLDPNFALPTKAAQQEEPRWSAE